MAKEYDGRSISPWRLVLLGQCQQQRQQDSYNTQCNADEENPLITACKIKDMSRQNRPDSAADGNTKENNAEDGAVRTQPEQLSYNRRYHRPKATMGEAIQGSKEI